MSSEGESVKPCDSLKDDAADGERRCVGRAGGVGIEAGESAVVAVDGGMRSGVCAGATMAGVA